MLGDQLFCHQVVLMTKRHPLKIADGLAHAPRWPSALLGLEVRVRVRRSTAAAAVAPAGLALPPPPPATPAPSPFSSPGGPGRLPLVHIPHVLEPLRPLTGLVLTTARHCHFVRDGLKVIVVSPQVAMAIVLPL